MPATDTLEFGQPPNALAITDIDYDNGEFGNTPLDIVRYTKAWDGIEQEPKERVSRRMR